MSPDACRQAAFALKRRSAGGAPDGLISIEEVIE